MESSYIPMRAVIRQKARMQLLEQTLNGFELPEAVDEDLLKELAETLFKSGIYRHLYRSSPHWEEAAAIEDRLAYELAENYRSIKERQSCPIVQELNALL